MKITNAFITNVAFPQELDAAFDMAQKNHENYGMYMSDMEALLEFDCMTDEEKVQCDIIWTSPKWTMPGDLMLFYHAVSSEKRIKALLNQIDKDKALKKQSGIRAFLEAQIKIGQTYGGTIFGYAFAGEALRMQGEDELLHFRSHVFARPNQLRLLDRPVTLAEFRSIVEPMRNAAITHVTPSMLEKMLPLLNRGEKSPLRIEYKPSAWSTLNRSNWRALVSANKTSFLTENQVRSAIIDHFLADLKDERTAIHKECDVKKGKAHSFADYFVQISKTWIPCEAKLNADLETDVYSQVAQYVGHKAFKLRDGKSIGIPRSSPLALLCDQKMLQLVDPAKRKALAQLPVQEVASPAYTKFLEKVRSLIERG